MAFTDEQKAALAAKLDPRHVKSRSQGGQSLSYIEAWHAIDEANRIFGFDGWDRELMKLEQVADAYQSNGKWRVAYRATVRIRVGGTDFVGTIIRDGTGYGSGIGNDLNDAHESAMKEAESDAMKRALMTFGNPFGLALYDKTKANVGTDEPAPRQQRQQNGNGDGIDLKAHWTDWAKAQTEMFKAATRTDLAEWQTENRERCSTCLKYAPKAHARMMELFDLRLDDICIAEGPKPEASIIAAG